MQHWILYLALVFATSTGVLADEADKADAAVANILFEYEDSEEYASYRINDDGSVDLIFASNTPDDLYETILTRLQNHADITSVLASQGGPVCKLF